MLEYLSVIFGNHVGPIYLGGFSNPIVYDIFEKFNVIILSIATVIVTYVSFSSTINTAQDGQFMGKSGNFSWILLRTIIGLALLFPMPKSGYSMIQTGSIWLAIQSNNFASKTLTVIVDYFDKGISIVKNTTLDEAQTIKLKQHGEELSWELLKSAICMASMHSISHGNAKDISRDKILASAFANQYGKLIFPYQATPKQTLVSKDRVEFTSYFNIGVKNAEATTTLQEDYSAICGCYKAQAIVSSNELTKETMNLVSYSKNAVNKKTFALYAMFQHLRPLAERIVAHGGKLSHYIPVINEYIKDSGSIYASTISDLIKPHKGEHSFEVSMIIEQLKQLGWLGLGALYTNLGHAPKIELLDTVQDKPIPVTLLDSGLATVPECNIIKLQDIEDGIEVPELSYLQKYIGTKLENYFLCEKLAIVTTAHYEKYGVTTIVKPAAIMPASKFITTLIPEFYQLIEKTKVYNSNDPLVLQTMFGNKLIAATEHNLEQFSKFTLDLERLTLILLWLCGAILVFYVPLMPGIIYTVAVVGWLVLVVQSFFVLPILALSLLLPSNDLLARIGKNLSLPIEIIIRPVLMVVSFVLAIRLYKIAIEFVNLIILNTVTVNLLGVSKIAAVIVIIIYVLLVLLIINMCFSWFYKISQLISNIVQHSLASQDWSITAMPLTTTNTVIAPQLMTQGTKAQSATMPNTTAAASSTTTSNTIAAPSSTTINSSKDPSGITMPTKDHNYD